VGARVTLLTVVGTDEAAKRLRALLEQQGIVFEVLDGFLYPGHRVRRMHAVPEKTGAGLMSRLQAAADAAGVVVGVVPTGVAALPTVTSGSNGTFTVSSVPAGGGTLVLSTLPSGCTAPADLSYTGVTAGGTLTRNLTLNCVAGAHTYPVTGTWGTIANTGPTGKQVTLTIAVDMGSAPGRSDVSGAAADPLAAVTLQVVYDSTKIAYQPRSLLSPDEFDLGVAGTVNGTGVNKITTIAVASTSAQTKTGAFQLVRLTFNIRSGASGTVTPTLTVAQMLAGAPSVVVTTSVVVQPLAPLTIPP
jgi:hypothetical protein